MSDFDDLIRNFKTSITMAGLYVSADENTDIPTTGGAIPSLAKQVKLGRLRIESALPDLSNVLVLDEKRDYNVNQKAWGRTNLGLDKVNNTADADKPMSTPVQQAVQDLLKQIQAKQNTTDRNVVDGYPAYAGARLPLIGAAANVPKGYFTQKNTQEQNWEMPNKSGVVALLSDVSGLNTGTNTGDETPATIKQKLGITTLSGSNTGDFDSVTMYATVGSLPNTGVDKRIYIVKNNATMYFWNGAAYQLLTTLITNSDSVPEGDVNKYFTQLRSIESVLTTYAVSPSGVVLASDTVVGAISKLQAQITDSIADYTTKLAQRELLTNKATSFATVNHTLYPTVQAVKTYADALVAGVIKDCGNWDASNNAFPTTGGSGTNGAIKKGNFWYVNVAGTLGGVAVNIGDSFRALVDTPGQTAANWAVLESNIGYVPYNASNPDGFISAINSSMVIAALAYTPLKPADKDASGGVVGLTGYAMNIKNASGGALSRIVSSATAARTWTLPNKSGTLATLEDLSGTSSGNNTGDETQETILAKLGATTVTGSNTGDQVIALTGDVTGTGTGSFAATIAPNAVSLAKLQTVNTATFLGRSSAGTGNVEALTVTFARSLLGVNNLDNTSDANKPVSTAQQTALNAKENTANKATDFTTIDNVKFPTTLAVKNFVDTRLVAAVVDCGSWDASTGLYPNTGGTGVSGTIKKGNLFFISVPGTIAGVAYDRGDSIRALVDGPGQTAASWDALESNIGYVPYNATNPAGYISAITNAMIIAALSYTPENQAMRNALNGYAALSGYSLVLKNSAGGAPSQVRSSATVARTWTFPDKDGTVAMLSDLTGLNSGTNSGDETKQTILDKLGATEVTGSNTGDETGSTLRSKLNVTTLSGSNTGDETKTTLVNKLGYTPMNKSGDKINGAFDFADGVSLASAATLNLSAVNSNVVEVTGNVTITSVVLADGQMRFVRFSGEPKLTHGANLVLPTKATIAVEPGDWAILVGRAGSPVHCLHYARATGVPVIGNSREIVRNITANTATTTIDLNNGDDATVFKITIAANTTINFTNPPPSPNGEIFNFSVITINDGTAGRAMAFGNTIQWSNKQLPPRTTAANAKDVWAFYIDNGVYGGSLSIQDQG